MVENLIQLVPWKFKIKKSSNFQNNRLKKKEKLRKTRIRSSFWQNDFFLIKKKKKTIVENLIKIFRKYLCIFYLFNYI